MAVRCSLFSKHPQAPTFEPTNQPPNLKRPSETRSPKKFEANVLLKTYRQGVFFLSPPSDALKRKSVEALTDVYKMDYVYDEQRQKSTSVLSVESIYYRINKYNRLKKTTLGLGHIFYRSKEMFLLGAPYSFGAVQSLGNHSEDRTLKFHLKDLLGYGTFGVAYLAEKPTREKFVVKATRGYDQESFFNAKKEARILNCIRDLPHTVKYESSYSTNNLVGGENFVVVTEYADLTDLSTHLTQRGQPLKFKKIAAFAWMMMDFLQHFHKQGYSHLDLKPANILFGESPLPEAQEEICRMTEQLQTPKKDLLNRFFLESLCQVRLKVIDFGEARLQTATDSYRLCSTPNYRDPHMVGTFHFPKEFDYFSLGVILYELYTGEKFYKAAVEINNLVYHYAPESLTAETIQLVLIHIADALIGVPSQENILKMEPTLRREYFDFKDNKYRPRDLCLSKEQLSHIGRILQKAKYRQEQRLQLARDKRQVPDDLHECFTDLLFNHLMSGNRINPYELQEHPFFQKYAMS